MTISFMRFAKRGCVGLTGALLLVATAGVGSVAADTLGSVGTWATVSQTITDSPVEASYATANGFAYSIGGTNNFGNLNDVLYTKLNTDGTTSAWTASPNVLPNSLFYSSAVTANGYIYVLGGYNFGFFDSVYYSKLNADGSIGAWTTSPNNLPTATYEGAAVAANGYLYFMGGFTGGGSTNAVYYSKLNNDGSIGAWTTSPSVLPDNIYNASATTANGYAYIFGGQGNGGTLSSVYYAKLNTNGTVGTWQSSSNALPQAIYAASTATENGFVYIIGGRQGSSYQTYVMYADLNVDGTVGTWTTSANSLPQPRGFGMAYGANNYIYYAGGANGGTAQNTVFAAFVTPRPTPPPVPSSASQTPSGPAAPDAGYGTPVQNSNLAVWFLAGAAVVCVGFGAGLRLQYAPQESKRQ